MTLYFKCQSPGPAGALSGRPTYFAGPVSLEACMPKPRGAARANGGLARGALPELRRA
jgi:hypothetical protein